MKVTRRLLCLLLSMALLAGFAHPLYASFADVAGTRWADAVGYLRGLGVLAGDPDGLFRPLDGITRAEAAKIIVSILGKGDLAGTQAAAAFPDTAGHWANGYIAVARTLGIISGFPDGTFCPQANVTYVQMAKMLLEATGNEPVPGLDWPFNYMAAAQSKGMFAGVPAYEANSAALRGDCAVLAANVARTVAHPQTGQTLAQSVFGAAADMEITPSESTLRVGAAVQLAATIMNSAGDPLAGLPLTFSTSDPVNSTVSQTGSFRATAPGLYTVTCCSSGMARTVTITVLGVPVALRATPPAQTVTATGKSVARITVEAVDSLGNLAAADGTVVTMSYAAGGNGGAVTLGDAAKTIAGGRAQFEVTSKTRSGVKDTIVFTAQGFTEARATVTTVTQTAAAIKLSLAPSSLQSNVAAAGVVTAALVDQSGVQLIGSGAPVTFTISGPGSFTGGSLTPQTKTTSAGAAQVAIYTVQGGTGRITVIASSPGLPTTAIEVPTHTAGAPIALRASVTDNTVTAGQVGTGADTARLRVETVDSQGRPAANAAEVKLTLVLKDGPALSAVGLKVSGDLTIDAGYSSTGDIIISAGGTSSGLAGAHSLKVLPSSSGLSPASLTIAVQTGPLKSLLTSLTDNTKLGFGSAGHIDVTVRPSDAAGNSIAQSGVEIRAGWQDPGNNNVYKPTINGVAAPPTDPNHADAVRRLTDGTGKAVFTLSLPFPRHTGDDFRLIFRSGSISATTATVTVVALAVEATECKIVNAGGSTIQRLRADRGETACLDVLLRDDREAPLPGWDVTIEFSGAGANVQNVSIELGTRVQPYSNGKLVVRTSSSLGTPEHGRVRVAFEGATAGSFSITVRPSGAVPWAIAHPAFRTDPGTVVARVKVTTPSGGEPTGLSVQGDTPTELRLVSFDHGGNAMTLPGAVAVLVDAAGGLYSSGTAGQFRETAEGTAVGQGESFTIRRGTSSTAIYYVQPSSQTGLTFGLQAKDSAWTAYLMDVVDASLVTGQPDTARVTFEVTDCAGTPLLGIKLTLSPTAGSVATTTVTTGSSGRVTVTWTGGAGGSLAATLANVELAGGGQVAAVAPWPSP